MGKKPGKHCSQHEIRMLMAQCAQMAYGGPEPIPQSRIADRLGISASYVSRLLAQAKVCGIVEMTINLPRDVELQLCLKNHYGLRDVFVAPIAVPREPENPQAERETLNRYLGTAAATYLHEIGGPVVDGARVGVSCGSTLFETVMALPPGSFKGLQVCALTVESMPEFAAQSPSTIAGLLCAKCSKNSTAYAPQFVPRRPHSDDALSALQDALQEIYDEVLERIAELNVALVGIGDIDLGKPERSYTQILTNAGVTEEDLAALNIVGEINNRPYDESGNDCFEALTGLGQTIFAIEIEAVRKLAQRGDVVVIAGGKDKVKAIDVALRNHFATRFVTDIATAERLLEMW